MAGNWGRGNWGRTPNGHIASVGGIDVGRVIVHGTIGGVFSEAGGGSFKSGFLGSAFSQFAGEAGLYSNLPDNVAVQTVAAAVVGGTASKLGGGKFANGAVTAAFGHLFNDMLEETPFGRRLKEMRDRPKQLVEEVGGTIQALHSTLNEQMQNRVALTVGVDAVHGGGFAIDAGVDTMTGAPTADFIYGRGEALMARATVDINVVRTGAFDGPIYQIGGCAGVGLGGCITFTQSLANRGHELTFSFGYVSGGGYVNGPGHRY